MSSLLKEVKELVNAPGPFRHWRHEASNQARPDLRNLIGSAQAVVAQCRDLPVVVGFDSVEDTRVVAFAIMQNLYPIVEAIDTDSGQYLAQAVEALRKVGANV